MRYNETGLERVPGLFFMCGFSRSVISVTLVPMPSSLYFTLVIVSFLASLTAYFQKDAQRYLRLFPVFLLMTIVVEIFATWLYRYGKSTTVLYNFFSSFEFLFYIYILREIIQSRTAKKVIFHAGWAYILFIVLNFLFIQKIVSFTSLTYALGCLLIGIICIYYFFELFQSKQSVNLVRHPSFWICSALLFYYCCSFPIFGLLNFLKQAPSIIRKNINDIVMLLNVFLYSSFTIAFLCRIRVRNSTS